MQPNGHFIPPPTGYGRPSPPTARRRIVSPPPPESAEPDRAFVEKTPANEPTLRSKPEPEPAEVAEVAAKKKPRTRLTAEQRSIAVARVEKLVGAGNQLKDALRTVGKELGASPLSVRHWVFKERKAKSEKPAKKRAASKAAVAPASNGSPVHHLAQVDVLAEQLIMSIGGLVRTIVREEIRRMLS
jgi:hypothetical protein